MDSLKIVGSKNGLEIFEGTRCQELFAAAHEELGVVRGGFTAQNFGNPHDVHALGTRNH